MNFEIDSSPLPVYILMRYQGKISVKDFDDALTTLVSFPTWKTGTKQLVDHTKTTFKDFPSDGMRQVVEILKKHSMKLGNGACALVVKGPLGFGLARMYEMLGGAGIHSPFGIFYTIDEAIEWLKSR